MKRKGLLAAVMGITVLIAAARWRTIAPTQSSFSAALAPPCQVALAQGPQASDNDRTIRELQERARARNTMRRCHVRVLVCAGVAPA